MNRPPLDPTLEYDPSACPPPKRLDDFLNGKLTEADSKVLEEHFSGCEHCLRVAEDLTLGADVNFDTSADFELAHSQDTVGELIRDVKAVRQDEGLAIVRPGRKAIKHLVTDVDVPDGYEVMGELGRGGMGVVYQARHIGLKRVVALKMILGASHVSQAALDRFAAEGAATAKLNHPGIVQVFDSGQHNGVPYIALRFIEGGTLGDMMPDGAPLPPKQAATIIGQLADAVAYANAQGIIHRDLKPANVLMASNEDGTVQPKITDFGLAKELAEDSGLTQTGAVLGTPSYMAPEQASGDSSLHGPSVDIYALGAILYRMLTGRAPFRGENSIETIRQVLQNEPVPPRNLSPSVPVDLETIALKCLSKTPEARYATARDLADELRRYLSGEPIIARPISTTMRVVRWAIRNPGTSATVFGIALLLATVAIGSSIAAGRFKSLATAKSRESQKAQAREIEANEARIVADEATERANQTADQARRRLYASEMVSASITAKETRGLDRVRQLLERWIPEEDEEDLRGWEWYFHWSLLKSGLILEPEKRGLVGFWADWSADDQSVLLKDHNGKTHFYDAHSGKYIDSLGDPEESWGAACLSPDGTRYVTVHAETKMRLWDLKTKTIARDFPAPAGPIVKAQWSRNGEWIAALGLNHLMVWNANTLDVLFELKGVFRENFCLHPSRPFVSLANHQTYNFETGKMILDQPETKAFINWSPDGKVMAMHQLDRGVVFADAETGETISTWEGDGNRLLDVTWRNDGRSVAIGCQNSLVYIVDIRRPELFETLRGHLGKVSCVAWSRDGVRLLSVGFGKHVRIRSMSEASPEFWVLGGQQLRGNVAFDQTSERYATDRPEGIVTRSLTMQSDEVTLRYAGNEKSDVVGIAFRPESDELAILDIHSRLCLYDQASAATRELNPGNEDEIPGSERDLMHWESSGQFLVAKLGRQEIAVFDVVQDRRWDWQTKQIGIQSVRFSADGSRVLCGSANGVWVWDFENQAEPERLEVAAGFRTDAAWSPDGKWLAIADGANNCVLVFDATTLQLEKTLQGPTFPTVCLNWSPDGMRLIAGSEDGRAFLWDTKTGFLVSKFSDLPWYCMVARWSPDGKKLVTSGIKKSRVRQILE